MANPTSLLPADGQESAARRRELLAQGWLDDSQVEALLCLEQSAHELRLDGDLLGAWVADTSRFLHPLFQFDNGTLIPTVAKLLKILPRGSGSGWQEVEWFCSPHALLQKQTPAEVLVANPDRVLYAARQEFEGNIHRHW